MEMERKKKLYEFALLAKRPIYTRCDVLAVVFISGALVFAFGWQLTDKEDLLAIGMLVMTVLLNGVLLLANFWSVAYHEAIAYKNLQGHQIEKCSHVRVRVDNKKQNVVKRFIVPIQVKTLQMGPGNVIVAHQIEVQKKKFSYSKEKKTFSQIPYPVDDTIEFYQSSEGLQNELSVKKADLVWGPNKMHVPIP